MKQNFIIIVIYGFRPNRSAEHAKATMCKMINIQKLHFVVDIDIKGFFDNVDHEKLLKQMWTIGLQDKRFLCIISAMLKAEIEGVGMPNKGTPQGGILSPLLSNIVLNELDWWISNQWESMEPKYPYSHNGKKSEQYERLQHSRNVTLFGMQMILNLYSAQCRNCRILKTRLDVNNFHCHHIKPIGKSGDDAYKNLIIFHLIFID